jgi:hypothetical protein
MYAKSWEEPEWEECEMGATIEPTIAAHLAAHRGEVPLHRPMTTTGDHQPLLAALGHN